MIVLGLTGSIGMGKSTTARMFAAAGVPVNDADRAVHMLYRGPAVAPVEAAFPGVAVDGVIDRGRLGERVLSDPDAMKALEAIVHPMVRDEENAFLDRFYSDRDRWALQTQLAFLASRFKQQKALQTRDLFAPHVVSDYTFDKDRIFAHVTLTGDEVRLYETLYGIMEPSAPVSGVAASSLAMAAIASSWRRATSCTLARRPASLAEPCCMSCRATEAFTVG